MYQTRTRRAERNYTTQPDRGGRNSPLFHLKFKIVAFLFMNQHPVDSQNSEFVPHNYHHSTHQKANLVRGKHYNSATARQNLSPTLTAPLLRRYSSPYHVFQLNRLAYAYTLALRYLFGLETNAQRPHSASQLTRRPIRVHYITKHLPAHLHFYFP